MDYDVGYIQGFSMSTPSLLN